MKVYCCVCRKKNKPSNHFCRIFAIFDIKRNRKEPVETGCSWKFLCIVGKASEFQTVRPLDSQQTRTAWQSGTFEKNEVKSSPLSDGGEIAGAKWGLSVSARFPHMLTHSDTLILTQEHLHSGRAQNRLIYLHFSSKINILMNNAWKWEAAGCYVGSVTERMCMGCA